MKSGASSMNERQAGGTPTPPGGETSVRRRFLSSHQALKSHRYSFQLHWALLLSTTQEAFPTKHRQQKLAVWLGIGSWQREETWSPRAQPLSP